MASGHALESNRDRYGGQPPQQRSDPLPCNTTALQSHAVLVVTSPPSARACCLIFFAPWYFPAFVTCITAQIHKLRPTQAWDNNIVGPPFRVRLMVPGTHCTWYSSARPTIFILAGARAKSARTRLTRPDTRRVEVLRGLGLQLDGLGSPIFYFIVAGVHGPSAMSHAPSCRVLR